MSIKHLLTLIIISHIIKATFTNMNKKIPVGILGGTGMVGQKYIELLRDHPWFEVVAVGASSRSAGKYYADAANWIMTTPIPDKVKTIVVYDIKDVDKIASICRLVFSAFDMGTPELDREFEKKYANAGVVVISNNSAHRFSPEVPIIIPEVNYEHLKIIPAQQKKFGWIKGFIVTKPNCAVQGYITPIYALQEAGFEISKIIITTMQASSGAGYPGIPSLDLIDNVIPFIWEGEEEKSINETLKIYGSIHKNKITPHRKLKVSVNCNRVPVLDGHTVCVNVQFEGKKPSIKEIIRIWSDFKSLPQKMELPFAPKTPIIYKSENNRPQPRKDRDSDKGMAITVGKLKPCDVFDIKFVSLVHNTMRGGAGGAILTAELLLQKNYL